MQMLTADTAVNYWCSC